MSKYVTFLCCLAAWSQVCFCLLDVLVLPCPSWMFMTSTFLLTADPCLKLGFVSLNCFCVFRPCFFTPATDSGLTLGLWHHFLLPWSLPCFCSLIIDTCQPPGSVKLKLLFCVFLLWSYWISTKNLTEDSHSHFVSPTATLLSPSCYTEKPRFSIIALPMDSKVSGFTSELYLSQPLTYFSSFRGHWSRCWQLSVNLLYKHRFWYILKCFSVVPN